ncbi:VirK/YbjX family protein, partial [Salmonella enterica]
TLQGELEEDDYYHLPRQIPHRSLEEIASKRRSEYRRRYQLLDSLEAQIRQTFSQGFAASRKNDAA